MERRTIASIATVLVCADACSPSAPPAEEPAPHSVKAPPDSASAPPPTVAASAAAVAPPSAPPPAPAAPPACPADMKLIDGDYCSRVAHKCLVSWYAPQNKKQVCEQFAPSAECVGKREPKRYCIDTYSWPNEKGARPEVMNNFHQAQVKCAAVGKRLCTETEWSFACEGPKMLPFPYGFIRDPRKCNGDHRYDNPSLAKMVKRDPKELARLWKGVPSGSQPECISDFGVADLPANTDEVVMAESPSAKYSSVHTGGPWYSGVRNQCRPKVYTHGEETFGYFLSFRCCAEADGPTEERRSKKQIRDGVTWKRIEQIAGFSVAQMQEALEKKKRGECTCKKGSIRCNTMCGTTLGPGAKDATDETRILHPARKRIKTP